MRETCFDGTVDLRFLSSWSHFWKWCTLRFTIWVNCFPHLSRRQVKGFVCWWTNLWAHMLPCWANRLWQTSQEKGFSPVWRRWWVWAWSGMLHISRRRLRTFRLPSCEKRHPHKGFSQIYDGQHICLFHVQKSEVLQMACRLYALWYEYPNVLSVQSASDNVGAYTRNFASSLISTQALHQKLCFLNAKTQQQGKYLAPQEHWTQ